MGLIKAIKKRNFPTWQNDYNDRDEHLFKSLPNNNNIESAWGDEIFVHSRLVN